MLAYTVIAVVIFWPLVTHLSKDVLKPYVLKSAAASLRYGARDTYHFLWNFWWVRTSLASGQNILYTKMFFYPQGVSLALQTIDYVDAFIAIPITAILGLVAAFNIIMIASFVLSGFTMFLLAKHLTGSFIASFGAGLIFAYAPQHITEAFAGHPNLSSIQWIPAFLLALILLFERKQLRYALISAVLLVILTYTELELMIIALIAGLIYIGYFLIATQFSQIRRVFFLICLMVVVWIALASPYLVPAFQSLGVVHAAPSLGNAIKNAAKPQLFLIPPPSTVFYGNLFFSAYKNAGLSGGPSQWVVFVGYAALAMAIVGSIVSKDRRRFAFIIIAVLAFLFALGPSNNPTSLSIQTPYTILYDSLSVLHYFRDESRFSILLMLGLAVMAAYGIDGISKLADGYVKKSGISRGTILGLIVLALIMIEFAPTVVIAPVPSSPVFRMIARDNSQFSVLELPVTGGATDRYLYESTLFDKPLINGKISQVGQDVPTYVYYQVFLCDLVFSYCPADNVISQPYNVSQIGPVVMTYYNIKYVLINGVRNTKKLLYDYSTLNKTLGSPIYSGRTMAAFELSSFTNVTAIERMTKTTPLTLFGSGWIVPKNTSITNQISVNGSADLVVYTGQAGQYTMYIKSTLPSACISNIAYSNDTFQCGDYNFQTGVSSYPIFLGLGQNVLNVTSDVLTSMAMISFTQSS